MMKKSKTPPLVVYKASAGSGKTFTLAAEYIKLLIDNPQSFRNILAVTFTNKATEEMKTRILSQLNGLANGYADSSDYMKKIVEETGTDTSLVKERASMALHGMIHNYDHFHVETIDKFFGMSNNEFMNETPSETKIQMAEALKKLITDQPFSKITVQDIVAACNINRNTFYYHFETRVGTSSTK